MKGNLLIGLALLLAAQACNLPAPGLTTEGGPLPSAPAATTAPRPADLSHRPLHWFAPLPPQPGGPYDGSDDYMALFTPEAAWATTAGYLQVFKLYGGWVARPPSEAQLRQAIDAIRQRGLALAVEVGPLNPTDQCGLYIEGFAGEEGVETVRRIKRLGGVLNLIAFDEPYYYGHFYEGQQACQWSAEKIAQDMAVFIQRVRYEFPDVIIGDIEPLTGPANAGAYNSWLSTFRQVNGYDLAFLHLDIDWSDTRWPEQVKAVADYGRQIGVPIGTIFNGNSQDQTDEAWLSIAGERFKRYAAGGGQLDHIIFQSWHDKPDRALPESEPYTYTGFIRTYFENPSAIGLQAASSQNVALLKSVRVSAELPGNEGRWAVDGDPGTIWSAGDGPRQWLEIDLGAPFAIREIRLQINQYPAGATVHEVLGRSGDGQFTLLHRFAGETSDSQTLVATPPSPWDGIQYLRVETLNSPSWVSWREIEVMQAAP